MDEDILSIVATSRVVMVGPLIISTISSPLLVIYIYNNAHLWL